MVSRSDYDFNAVKFGSELFNNPTESSAKTMTFLADNGNQFGQYYGAFIGVGLILMMIFILLYFIFIKMTGR